MKNIIIGTAGHVDHGKTSLIRTLTGIETDRLREERERGMSIELGFAYFDLPCGARAGIVDVPGHERFIKNMLMGATGMDMVILVVAADEGVMPQTLEHFAILRLLDVKAGVVAITKADLVEPEWLELIEDDVKTLLKGSFLEGAPVVPVSATTGQGIAELTEALDSIASRTEERLAAGPFRMPVDRVFTIPGFGTVVTGTLRSGVVQVGEAAELLPSGLQTRVRQVQVHGKKSDTARAGSRVALNLAGIELADASRGDVVAAAGSLEPTSMVDVRLELLKEMDHPLAHRSRIRFHTGSVEIIGRIGLLDRNEAEPGTSVLAQVRLEQPTAVGRGDRFVLRRYSPGLLLGGGVILDAHPRRHRRNQPSVLAALLVREKGSPEEIVMEALLHAGPASLAADELAPRTGLSRSEVAELLKRLAENGASGADGVPVAIGSRWVHSRQLEALEAVLLDNLASYHTQHPLIAGMPREELRVRSGRSLDARVYNTALARLENAQKVVQDGHLVRRADHQVKLEGRLSDIAAGLLETFGKAGLNPPSADEVVARFGSREEGKQVFEVLVSRGDLQKISEGLYLDRQALSEARKTAVQLLNVQGSFTVSQFRDAVGSSRKVIVPLLEHFDAKRLTRRRGDERVLY